MTDRSFLPLTGSTKSLSAAATSGRAQLVADGTPGPVQVRLYNAGTDPVFIRPGDSTVVATTNDMPVAPGSVEVVTLDVPRSGSLYVAAITASAADIYFTVGTGI